MNVRFRGWPGIIVAAALVAGCKKDPTADLAGKPALLNVAPNQLTMAVGDSANVAARILDQTFTPLQGVVSASSATGGVASIGPASAPADPTGTQTVFTVRALAAGTTTITFTGGGLTSTAGVTVQ